LKDSTTVQLIDSVYDFGKVKQGEQVKHSFTFKNTGTKPLVVQDAHPSCGCTVAEKPDQPIAPGKEGLIKAVFDSHGRAGSQHKTLTVYSNTETSFHPLTFDVEVLAK